MKRLILLSLFVLGAGMNARAEEARFDGPQRPEKWGVNFGHWEPEEGVLVCRQLEKDNHAAASRWQIPLTDAVISCRVKFEGASFFHIGFDPAPKTLDKKGHLYSLVLTPTGATIKKHRDKADEKSQDATLATVKFAKPLTDWQEIQLKLDGNSVQVLIETPNGKHTMTATDDTFGVKKPAVVFRVGGGDLKLDDVQIDVKR
ncbi:MAG: hypothetical protein KDA78_10710 [Planctomycetaceae bacterium]|nr:hypothetical protein [Planctomycetaceae bacterium]